MNGIVEWLGTKLDQLLESRVTVGVKLKEWKEIERMR